MANRPKVTRDPLRCQDTRNTIVAMCKYQRSDRKIAQHVRVPEGHVAAIRATLSSTDDINKQSRQVHCSGLVDHAESEKGAGEYLAHCVAARKGSMRLAAAMRGVA